MRAERATVNPDQLLDSCRVLFSSKESVECRKGPWCPLSWQPYRAVTVYLDIVVQVTTVTFGLHTDFRDVSKHLERFQVAERVGIRLSKPARPPTLIAWGAARAARSLCASNERRKDTCISPSMGWRAGPDADEVRHQVSGLDPSTASPANASPRESPQGRLYPCATFLEPIRKKRSSRRTKQTFGSISSGKRPIGRPACSVDRLQRNAATSLKVKPYDGKRAVLAMLRQDEPGQIPTSDKSP